MTATTSRETGSSTPQALGEPNAYPVGGQRPIMVRRVGRGIEADATEAGRGAQLKQGAKFMRVREKTAPLASNFEATSHLLVPIVKGTCQVLADAKPSSVVEAHVR
jgi:hypothetical protein